MILDRATIAFGAALCVCATLCFGAAGARAADDPDTDATPTVSAVSSSVASVSPVIRKVSVEIFRPAPMPNEGLAVPTTKVADADADQPSVHPDLLKMHETDTGVLGGTSSEYDHNARIKPAGGMSLSIPMQ